ncbi:hypothetical protein RCH16_001281 [Cryobacterium sp. MP_M5]|uniref:hypothetical protein n=1 Tax=unclassified Cryobacterium TaxID=2649013 RepID=UPI0018C9BBB5|nr:MULTISPECIES: hypothetical protein [unclassified Cryobacterium]MBG6056607.1 hypothetical protein [Cryobacterium sp. MP_M3]MEC5176279.1 hypothetical protein [Cryobacterium sp. MP_M5]
MGFLDRLLGRDEPERPAARPATPKRTDDEIAVERYEYLLRTAPPETIEQVHTEAFGKLTEEQRDLLFRRLSENAAAAERPANAEPATLAQAATRQELRQPGTLARSLGGQGQGGLGFGGMVGSTILGTVAGYVIGSALMSAFLPGDAGGADAGGDSGDSSGDSSGGDGAGAGADTASSGGDMGGGFGGDSGGGFGGGDFGGGDFGGF